MSMAIGIDMGATKIAFALVDDTGAVLAEHRIMTEQGQGVNHVIENLVEGIHQLIEQAESDVLGIGMGSPGHIDPINGIVKNAVNLGWRGVPLVKLLKKRLDNDLPIYIDQDVRTELVGELQFGVAREQHNAVMVAIGTGLGGAALVNGQLVTGGNFAAMELGHLTLPGQNRLCNCGQYGCVETVLSGSGVVRGIVAHRERFPESDLVAIAEPAAKDWLIGVAKGDLLAREVLEEVRETFYRLVVLSSVMLNPQLFILSGGFGKAIAPYLLEGIDDRLLERTLPEFVDGLQVTTSALDNSAIGGAAMVWYRQQNEFAN